MEQEIINVKRVVEELMLTDERCKSNDKWLFFQALKEYGIDLNVSYEDTLQMICPESVRRLRQKYQEVDKKRLMKDPTAKPIFLPLTYDADYRQKTEDAQDRMREAMKKKEGWEAYVM